MLISDKNRLFTDYTLDHCYDEMFDPSGAARPPYEAMYRLLLDLRPPSSGGASRTRTALSCTRA